MWRHSGRARGWSRPGYHRRRSLRSLYKVVSIRYKLWRILSQPTVPTPRESKVDCVVNQFIQQETAVVRVDRPVRASAQVSFPFSAVLLPTLEKFGPLAKRALTLRTRELRGDGLLQRRGPCAGFRGLQERLRQRRAAGRSHQVQCREVPVLRVRQVEVEAAQVRSIAGCSAYELDLAHEARSETHCSRK